MPSLINNLDPESILMLYAAGELSAEDQARVEQMLADDPSLRAAHEQLVAAQQSLDAQMSSADAKAPLPAPQTSSVRHVSAAIKQWHVNRLAAKPSTEVRNGRRLGWAYALGSLAAIIIVTVFIFYSHVDDARDQSAKNPPDVNRLDDDGMPNTTGDDNKVAENAVRPSDTDNQTGAQSEVAMDNPIGEMDTQLANAEIDLTTLSVLTDSLRPDEGAVTP